MRQALPPVLAATLTAAAAAQDPSHLLAPDWPEMTAAGSTIARSAPFDPSRPDARVYLHVGGGDFEHETSGSATVSDETSARLVRFGFEAFGEGLGGGLRLEGMISDDDLFAETAGSPAEATDAELFLHFTGLIGDSQHTHIPARFGLFLRDYRFEEQSTGFEVDWASVGVRAEIEPDFELVRGDTVRWSLFGLLGLGFGFGNVSTDPETFDADTTVFTYDLGVGTRLQLSHFEVGLGLMRRATNFDESEDVGGLMFREVDTELTALFLTLGAVF